MAKTKESTTRRAQRVRRQIKKVANGRPRLSVHRSSKNIYAQVIDDAAGRTLVAASTLEGDLKGSLKTGADTAAAAARRSTPTRDHHRSSHQHGCEDHAATHSKSVQSIGPCRCLDLIQGERPASSRAQGASSKRTSISI